MSKVFKFPKYLYLTKDHWLSEKLGIESFHQVILELVEPINNFKKLNEYLTLFKLTGEIKRINSVKDSEIGRELIIAYKTIYTGGCKYVQTYSDYALIPGKIALYRCIAINEPNSARKEINNKHKETIKKCKEIVKNSKNIQWMNSHAICVHKKIIWNLLKKELKPLGINMNQVSFEVANWEKEDKNEKTRSTL